MGLGQRMKTSDIRLKCSPLVDKLSLSKVVCNILSFLVKQRLECSEVRFLQIEIVVINEHLKY